MIFFKPQTNCVGVLLINRIPCMQFKSPLIDVCFNIWPFHLEIFLPFYALSQTETETEISAFQDPLNEICSNSHQIPKFHFADNLAILKTPCLKSSDRSLQMANTVTLIEFFTQ